MADLVQTRLTDGLWEGRLDGPPRALSATLNGEDVPGLEILADGAESVVRLPIPTSAIAEGVQTILIHDDGGEVLTRIVLHCGTPLPSDPIAEISALRAELDLLKRAFRRHCVGTALKGDETG
ncbi:MAG: hypothetical protein ACU0CI_07020 [Shimia sp.]